MYLAASGLSCSVWNLHCIMKIFCCGILFTVDYISCGIIMYDLYYVEVCCLCIQFVECFSASFEII